MWLARFKLGQFVPVSVWANASLTACPVLSIYNAAGTKVFGPKKMPPADFYGASGYFVLPVRLDSSFATGNYSAAINLTISSSPKLFVSRFEIIPGGDVDGAVTSMTYYRRPQADFLVARLDSDQRQLSKAPSEAS